MTNCKPGCDCLHCKHEAEVMGITNRLKALQLRIMDVMKKPALPKPHLFELAAAVKLSMDEERIDG